MKKFLLAALTVIAVTSAYAQNISGTVKDADGKALPFATVTVKDKNITVTTDVNGYYHIGNVGAGKHTLILSFVGFETQQKDVDITANQTFDFMMQEETYDLNETIVLPEGESMAYYILKQVIANKKSLKDRVQSYNGTALASMQSMSDFKVLPSGLLGAINFAMALGGYRKIMICLEEHKDLRVEMAKDVTYNNGKLKASDTRLTYFKPQLTEGEQHSFSCKDWDLDKNPYDEAYKEMDKLKKAVDKMQKKTGRSMDKIFTYEGCYDEGKHIVYILKTKNAELHVVSGLWQIRRYITDDGEMEKKYWEFGELKPNLYLPVSDYEEMYIDFDDMAKEQGGFESVNASVKELKTTDASVLSKGQQKKYSKYQNMLERLAENPHWSMIQQNTYNYQNIVVK